MNQNKPPVEDILHSLAGIRRAEAPPFLLTRITAAIARERVPVWRGAIAGAGLAALLTVNIWMLAALMHRVEPASAAARAPSPAAQEAPLVDNFQLYDNR